MVTISNIVRLVFTYAVYCLTLLSNCFLIYVIITSPYKQEIGTYRYLLVSFAIVDKFIASVRALLVPRVYGTDFGFIFYGENSLTFDEAWGTYGGIIFVVLFNLNFLILSFHYMYRVLAVEGIIALRGNRKWLLLFSVVLITVVYSIGWIGVVQMGFLPSELKRQMYSPYLVNETYIDITATPEPGFLAIVFRVVNDNGGLEWQWDAISSISLALSIILITAFVIGVSILRIVRGLRTIDNIASESMKALHKELFFALLIQSAIPCLFSYIPLAVIFIFSVFGWPLGGLAADLLIMTTAISPVVDPILIIACVGRYRTHALKSLARLVRMEGRFNDWRAGRSTIPVPSARL